MSEQGGREKVVGEASSLEGRKVTRIFSEKKLLTFCGKGGRNETGFRHGSEEKSR